MADRGDSDKPSPIEDLRKGLGLLFRAAKTTLEQIPTGELEKAVVSSAKEVGRAVENVSNTIEKQIFGKSRSEAPPSGGSKDDPAKVDASASPQASDDATKKTESDESKGQ